MLEPETSEKPIQILYYCSGWPTNIGNAFIDLGAIALLKAAVPNARIIFASEVPRWVFDVADRESDKNRRRFRSPAAPVKENALDIAAVTQCDLFVYAGMSMCEEFKRVNGPPALAVARRGVPVLLMGTGAEYYTEEEKKSYGEYLRELAPVAFLSRDDRSYDLFAEFVPNSQRGIDCGFFLSDAWAPARLTLPRYIVSAFDSREAPEIDARGRAVYIAHHECWGLPPAEQMRKPNTLISDLPWDYLNLYAGAEEVHSDRVHACVAALSYGRPARLYSGTPRGSLFEAAGAAAVRDRLVTLDMAELKEKKQRQIAYVRRTILEKLQVPA